MVRLIHGLKEKLKGLSNKYKYLVRRDKTYTEEISARQTHHL